MNGWNLPPGCRECDLPGNRPEDEAFDAFLDTDDFAAVENLGDDAVERAFQDWYARMTEPTSAMFDDD